MNTISDLTFRGRPIKDLSREELLEALQQAIIRVQELEGRPVDYKAMAKVFGCPPPAAIRAKVEG